MPITLESHTFDDDAISAETRQFNAQLETMLSTLTPNYQRQPQEIRDDRENGKGIFGPLQLLEEGRDRTVGASGREVPVRVFVPPHVDGVYLHIHGGGWVLGRAHHQDVRLWELARHARLAVVSVDYRLAPEHPYPAGPDDCESAALWLVANAANEFGSDRLFIGGESSGAHLSVVTLLRMRDRQGYRGFLGANLVYGPYDLQFTPSVANWGERELILSTPTIRWFTEQFVPEAAQRADPDVSPLYADLRGLPPALFTVGTMDPLLDDSLFMSARWLAAGNVAELAVYPGGVHGFNAFPLQLGREATERMHAFLGRLALRP